MAVLTIPCLALISVSCFVLMQPHNMSTMAHAINQNMSEATPTTVLQQPPPQAQTSNRMDTDNVPDERPCSQPVGYRQQMQYWPPSPAGPVGAPGPSGSAGIPGLPGGNGAQGARGERGDRGESGLPGYPGVMGDAGATGPVGLSGLIGIAGRNGTEGQKGESGQDYTPPAIVAFHVGLTTSTLLITTGFQIITFDIQQMNIGGDMSQHTGVFTCRIPGIYYFSYNFRAYAHGSYGIMIDLMMNNSVKSQMYMTAMSKHLMQSQSIILSMAKNDEVWLRANANTYLYGDPEMNTFTGFLIHAT